MTDELKTAKTFQPKPLAEASHDEMYIYLTEIMNIPGVQPNTSAEKLKAKIEAQ